MKTPRLFWVVVATLLVGCAVSCTVQPIGWQGANRMGTLPNIQTDSGGGMSDAGMDSPPDVTDAEFDVDALL
jgi:hypothetical protein